MSVNANAASIREVFLREAETPFSVDRPAGPIEAGSVFEATTSIEAFLAHSDRFTGIGHWHLSLPGRKMSWCKEVFRIHGLRPQDGEPDIDTALDYYHPSDRAAVERAVAGAIEDGESYEFEAELVRPDGETRRVFASCRVESTQGVPTDLFGIFIDVTERHQLQQRLEEQQALLRLFVQHVPAAVAMLDADLRYLAYSRRWIEAYRLEAHGDLTGLSHYDVFPDLPARWKDNNARALAGEVLTAEEDCLVGADGSVTYIDWSLYPWRRPDGRVGGIILYTQIVTDRVQARQKIDETSRWLGLALDAAGAMTWSLNLCDGALSVSPALRAFVGVDANGPVSSEDMAARVHLDDRGCIGAETLMRGMAEREEVGYRLRAHDGAYRYVRCLRTLVRDGAGRPDKLFGIVIDIDDIKRTEARLSESVAALERTNRDLEQFTAIASHDLQSPLRAISTLVGWIEEGLPDDASKAVCSNLDKLRGRVGRMETLLSDLLAYARAGHENFPYTDEPLRDLVLKVVATLSIPSAFQVEIDGDRPIARVQRPSVEAVLRNLINNAIKHHDRESGTVRVVLRALSDAVLITIEDDGPGIPAIYRRRAFHMLRTLQSRNVIEGSGSGLALVRLHVEAAGGEVRLADRADGKRGLAAVVRWPTLCTPSMEAPC